MRSQGYQPSRPGPRKSAFSERTRRREPTVDRIATASTAASFPQRLLRSSWSDGNLKVANSRSPRSLNLPGADWARVETLQWTLCGQSSHGPISFCG